MGGTLPTGHHREGRIPNFNESASGRKSELVDIGQLFHVEIDQRRCREPFQTLVG